MSVTIEAAAMTASTEVVEAVLKIVVSIISKALSLVESVASIARPSLGSHSLSAVAPDQNLRKELALAGA